MKKFIKILSIFIIIIISFLVYSRYLGIKNIQVKEYVIKNKNLKDEYYGLKIVHLTDIHYGRTIHQKELNQLVEKVNKVKPDILVFTGDLIDKDYDITNEEIDKLSSTLSKINTTIGKFAVNGEHDTKLGNWNLIIENAGFNILNNKYEKIYLNGSNYILITGVNVINGDLSSTDTLMNDNKPIYSILLVHKPDFVKNINTNNYNLILAGHSHNGQIRLPFIGPISVPSGSKKYYNPHYNIGDTDLFISGGIGCESYNFRFNNKPSFNLYRLVNK